MILNPLVNLFPYFGQLVAWGSERTLNENILQLKLTIKSTHKKLLKLNKVSLTLKGLHLLINNSGSGVVIDKLRIQAK